MTPHECSRDRECIDCALDEQDERAYAEYKRDQYLDGETS